VSNVRERVAEAVMVERDRCRELVAAWMIANSFATGHGDTIEDLLAELKGDLAEIRAKDTPQ